MIVVSDSSVLIGLSRINQLDILLQRFPQGVITPPTVWHEVVEKGGRRAGAQEVKGASWIQIAAPDDIKMIQALQTWLDAGEAEVIVLALERQGIALLDEREARKQALALNLPILGTVGLLIWAKQQGLISSLKTVLDELQNQAGFHLSIAVYQEALKQVGE